jgi:hypothetical protein
MRVDQSSHWYILIGFADYLYLELTMAPKASPMAAAIDAPLPPAMAPSTAP